MIFCLKSESTDKNHNIYSPSTTKGMVTSKHYLTKRRTTEDSRDKKTKK